MKQLFLKNKTLLIALSLILSVTCYGQKKRESPADSSTGKIGKATITFNYSSPSVKGRKIWGGLVPYNKVWRAGANEATTFTTDQTIHIEGQLLPAGKYGFFLIPGETKWVVIFNRVFDQWGAYDYDKDADILRVEVKPKTLPVLNERLVYKINSDGFSLIWENLEVPVLVK
ncbi:MAG TPA: DUF2911 domain-containing protein [Bacteroidia bacterium]|jgi:hypothetical protein|nr:DUF2911 domain-containing protein [Bacteroidia bacterium]